MKIRYMRFPPASWVLSPCGICEAIDVELCDDGYCEACHVSLTFECCLDGSWSDGMYANTGTLPPRFREGRNGRWSDRIAPPEERARKEGGT